MNARGVLEVDLRDHVSFGDLVPVDDSYGLAPSPFEAMRRAPAGVRVRVLIGEAQRVNTSVAASLCGRLAAFGDVEVIGTHPGGVGDLVWALRQYADRGDV